VKQNLFRLVGITLSVALVLSAFPAHAAESTSRDAALRHEAFLRGGRAIAAALHSDAAATESLVSSSIAEGIPASPTPPQATGDQKSVMSKVGWGALIAGFVVSGVLIYKYATGPGASIRNCSTCK